MLGEYPISEVAICDSASGDDTSLIGHHVHLAAVYDDSEIPAGPTCIQAIWNDD